MNKLIEKMVSDATDMASCVIVTLLVDKLSTGAVKAIANSPRCLVYKNTLRVRMNPGVDIEGMMKVFPVDASGTYTVGLGLCNLGVVVDNLLRYEGGAFVKLVRPRISIDSSMNIKLEYLYIKPLRSIVGCKTMRALYRLEGHLKVMSKYDRVKDLGRYKKDRVDDILVMANDEMTYVER